MKKIGYLGQDSGPVDRVYGCEFLGFVNFRVSKKRLDYILSASWHQLSTTNEKSIFRDIGYTWQSSNDPSTRRLCTFASRTVVIWASWTGLTFPFGYRIKTETSFFPLNPYMAADPVSPLVAPMTVKWWRSLPSFPSFRFTRKYSNRFPRNCNATSLKAKVGPYPIGERVFRSEEFCKRIDGHANRETTRADRVSLSRPEGSMGWLQVHGRSRSFAQWYPLELQRGSQKARYRETLSQRLIRWNCDSAISKTSQSQA